MIEPALRIIFHLSTGEDQDEALSHLRLRERLSSGEGIMSSRIGVEWWVYAKVTLLDLCSTGCHHFELKGYDKDLEHQCCWFEMFGMIISTSPHSSRHLKEETFEMYTWSETMKYLFTKVIRQHFSRQTRKNALQLLQHNSLLGRSHIRLGSRVSNTNTRKTSSRANDRGLRRKPCRSACLDIRGSTAGRTIDSGQYEAKVGRR